MNSVYRPLGKLSNIINATSLEMVYAYDDLVFSDHAVFIFRFDASDPNLLFLYFNKDCEQETVFTYEKQLREKAEMEGFKICSVGVFQLQQIEGKEEVQIIFN